MAEEKKVLKHKLIIKIFNNKNINIDVDNDLLTIDIDDIEDIKITKE